ncbi:MAG: twin-arginine translocation signal domain-containing protein, partial [Myxococcota bacterium]
MDRRDFMKGASLAGVMSLLPPVASAAAHESETQERGESGRAYADLRRTLLEVEAEYLSARRG